MRTFRLYRGKDMSGVSGTGYVAEGVEFSDGTVVLRWTSKTPTTEIHPDIGTLRLLHGHYGSTRVEWTEGHDGTDGKPTGD
jgi:hypothetical protein